MDVIELDNTGEDRTEQREETERAEREDEETSFIENTAKTDADNIRTRISSETSTQSETRVDLNDFSFEDAARSIAKNQKDKETRKEGAIQILRVITDENLGDYGDSSEELINNISEAKISEKGKLTALKFKGKDVKLTAKGKLDGRSANTDNREILKAIENAKVEYEASFPAVVDESAGSPMSDEASGSVQENVAGSLEDLVQDKYDYISKNDLDGNIEREIRRISLSHAMRPGLKSAIFGWQNDRIRQILFY